MIQESRLSTRALLKLIGSLAGLCLTSSHRKTAAAEPVATPPNIVVIVTDDMRDSDVGVLERISELVAANGTTFPNFFLTTPQCSPSRASLLTGLYAHNHGVRQNGFPLGGWDVFNENGLEDRTIAGALSDAGYHTVFAGKYLNGFPDYGSVPAGWDEFYATGEVVYTDFTLNENGVPVSYPAATGVYSADILLHRLLQSLDQTPVDTPVFLVFAPAAPHAPARPAARHEKAFRDADVDITPAFNEEDISDKPDYIRQSPPIDEETHNSLNRLQRKRLASLLAVDEAVSSIWDALTKQDRLANSYIFVLSDNGYLLGEHRAMAKQMPYDAVARVPMLACGPGFGAGKVDDRLIANIDIAPTLAAIAGIESFPADGISLLAESHRDAILIECQASPFDMEEISANESKGWPPTYQAVRTDRYLYVEYETEERELYDYQNDPFELDNLLADWEGHVPTPDAEAIADQLRLRLDAIKDCAFETCP